jgi:hypothetical protein
MRHYFKSNALKRFITSIIIIKKKGRVCIAYGIIDNEQLLISFDPIFSSLSIEIEPIIITYYQNPIAI